MLTLLARLRAAVDSVGEMRDSLSRIETALGVNRPYEEMVAAIERIVRGEPADTVWGGGNRPAGLGAAAPSKAALPEFAVDRECAALSALLASVPVPQIALFHREAGGDEEARARRLALLLRLAGTAQREGLARHCRDDLLAALSHLSANEIILLDDVSALRAAVESFRNASRHDGVPAQAIAQALAACGDAALAQSFARILEARGADGEAVRDAVARHRLSFDDLTRLSATDMQTLLREMDRSVLAIALASATEPVRAAFMAHLTSRAARMLVHDTPDAARDPVKAAAARRQVVDEVHRLIEAGDISGLQL